jgi:hypothetical protein
LRSSEPRAFLVSDRASIVHGAICDAIAGMLPVVDPRRA